VAVAYVSLGSNLGDRRTSLASAAKLMHQMPSTRVVRLSHLYASAAAQSPPDSPPYLNAAAELTTTLPPRRLLDQLLNLERRLGRRRPAGVVNAPRVIDLDLLGVEQEVVADECFTLPHPRLADRPFVLWPLAEIAPAWQVPDLRRTVEDLKKELEKRGRGREITAVGSLDAGAPPD
jgi:2-amino-4-hydroxy-6-hydroxymethyldihydropteridine diphosphokinase